MEYKLRTYFPPEWTLQSGIMLTWPHADTDWKSMLNDVIACFEQIAAEITKHELLLIVSPEPEKVRQQIERSSVMENVRFCCCKSNDTWARDHAPITLIKNDKAYLLDFCFNGWGGKFESLLDNAISRQIVTKGCLYGCYENHLDFILEGGSVESDGKGTLMTTSKCLLSNGRNNMSKNQIETYLKEKMAVEQVLWLDYGFLAGDDTDSHIDTLARFAPNDTILYIKCDDFEDEHFGELQKMEQQLRTFSTIENNPYRLLPLPMAAPIVENGERLPATYANFLVMNEVVLMPTYADVENDTKAKQVLQQAFPDRKIVGIDCRVLIRQHGSLHCVTMQFPDKVKINDEY